MVNTSPELTGPTELVVLLGDMPLGTALGEAELGVRGVDSAGAVWAEATVAAPRKAASRRSELFIKRKGDYLCLY